MKELLLVGMLAVIAVLLRFGANLAVEESGFLRVIEMEDRVQKLPISEALRRQKDRTEETKPAMPEAESPESTVIVTTPPADK
jgi:hypothetical protein